MPLDKNAMLANLPSEWPHDVLSEIQRRLAESGQKVVVLDDDPTGTQTVHGIPVLTEWSVESLQSELASDLPAFYVLTNTRALPLSQAQARNAEIARNLQTACGAPLGKRDLAVISRSDSTLRGHFPGEVDAFSDAFGPRPTAHPPYLIVPAFFAGGRYTVDDVHYVAYGDDLVPAGETEFARDAAFGYRASNLRQWVEEKTAGRIRASDVASISIDDIRRGGPEQVAGKLMALPTGSACVVNAAAERDLEVVALASLACESSGHPLLYRTAASFARARAGIAPRPMLTRDDLVETRRGAPLTTGGLIVVGSYVPKSSNQLAALIATGVQAIEVDVGALLSDAAQTAEIGRVTQLSQEALTAGDDVTIFTSRALFTGADAPASLAIGKRISESLVAVVKGIAVWPRFVLSKGGITSSDIATQALGVRRAMVLGQLLPGVPVWRLGPESRYPGSIYVVFPGNVGGPNALAEAVNVMRKA